MIIRILIAIIVMCGVAGAQEKAATSTDLSKFKPQQTTLWTVSPPNSGTTSTLQGIVTTTDTRVTIGAPPVTIDGESTDCTQAHLIKALKIASGMIGDPNQPPCLDCITIGQYEFYGGLSYGRTTPANEKRSQADRLKAEAERIEAESRRVQWVRDVLKACEK